VTGEGGRRRRSWRWVVSVWAVAVVGGGVLTLWLQDSTEPREPYSRQETHDSPAPPLRQDADDSGCPSATPRPDGPVVTLCAVSTMRR
jgi:hypothetical protein